MFACIGLVSTITNCLNLALIRSEDNDSWTSSYPQIPPAPQAPAPSCILSTESCCHPSSWCRQPWRAPHSLSFWAQQLLDAVVCLGCPCWRFALADLYLGLKEDWFWLDNNFSLRTVLPLVVWWSSCQALTAGEMSMISQPCAVKSTSIDSISFDSPMLSSTSCGFNSMSTVLIKSNREVCYAHVQF